MLAIANRDRQLAWKSSLRGKRSDPSLRANVLPTQEPTPSEMVQTRINRQTCLDLVRKRAGTEASLKNSRKPRGTGRPCCEAETPLAVENSVGEPAALWAPNAGTRERERGELPDRKSVV